MRARHDRKFFVISRQNELRRSQRLKYLQQTKAGDLAVEVESDASDGDVVVWMELDNPNFTPPSHDIDEILLALGIKQSELAKQLPLVVAQKNRIFLPMHSIKRLLALNPDFEQLSAVTRRWGLRGVVPYVLETVEPSCETHLRHFAPAAGVNEDPVTGTSNGYLGVLLQQSGIFPAGDFEYIGEQGHAIGREGTVQVRLTPGGVWIGGTACVSGQRIVNWKVGGH